MNCIVLYTDNYDPIRPLSPERKGVLLDAIFMYALGEGLPEMDEVTAMAFAFIKGHIDRATEKYEEISAKRSEAGKKHKGNQYTRKSEQMEQVSQVFQGMEQTEQDGTNGTIKENKRKENKIKEIKESGKENRFVPVADLAANYKTSYMFESFCIANNINRAQADALLDKFANELLAKGETSKEESDFATHFVNWARIELRERQNRRTNPSFQQHSGRPQLPNIWDTMAAEGRLKPTTDGK